MSPSENELWPSLVFSGRSCKIYGDICKADVASIGRMSPTHIRFF